jgi:hypothetical protein
LVYPHYQYYIDPDGTAYLTISRRYAEGDYFKAINGYWSPWSCWLTAILIKCGLQPIPASVIINTLGATGFLYISNSFFLHFGVERKLQWILNITLSLFLVYAIFWQSFDDLWECFFLLAALRIMLSPRFTERPALWVAMGFIGTLAYFAKSYSFPFFILNTLACTYFLIRRDKKQWLKISATSIGTMVLFALPWIVALHHKYGIWTTSTAGPLNTSWYLVGHPYWNEGINTLLPPPYPDSPYYWEDPYIVNGKTPHFWDSLRLFGLQILRLGYNCWKLLRSMLELSVFFPVIAVVVLLSFRSKKYASAFKGDIKIAILSFLLFPLGYLLVNFESRYIWYMLPLAMLFGALLLQNMEGKKWRNALLFVAPITFLIFPLWGMSKMYNIGRKDYHIAKEMKYRDMKGSFTGIVSPGADMQSTARIAYFSGTSFYAIPGNIKATREALSPEIQRYHVNYYMKVVADEPYFWVYFFDQHSFANGELQVINRFEIPYP